MFKVEPISRTEFDQWPVEGSGLPVRVINGVRSAGIDTIGALRVKPDTELLALRSIGRISIRDVQRFFELADRIEQGKQVFLTVQEIFDLFLDAEEMAVLARRYGLMRSEPAASRNFMTLQEIGNELDLTRERIRQVEAVSLANLKSRMAQLCLQPFYVYVRAFLRSRSGLATCKDAMDLDEQSWLAGYHPCPILLLLHDICPSHYTYASDCFSLWSQSDLATAASLILQRLQTAETPISLDALHASLASDLPGWSAQALGKWADHIPTVAATQDQRYFLFPQAGPAFLTEILTDTERPAHYRTIAQLMNDQLKPHARKGNGFVLKQLARDGRFVKAERGHYDLRDAPDQ